MTLLLILLAFGIILPQWSSFTDSVNTLLDADIPYIGLAVLLWLTTYIWATYVYQHISLWPLTYSKTLLVQLASGFTNRLLPMGAGIVTLNVRYLQKSGYSIAQAGTLVALNNILGFLGTVLLFLGTIIFSSASISDSFTNTIHVSTTWDIVILLFFIAGLYVLQIFGKKLLTKARSAVKTVMKSLVQQPARMISALCSSVLITVGYASALFAVGISFNAHLSLMQALIVMTIGVAAASITPTPGGIGGAEAGLIAALIAAGITPHQALITALMYRFITFWLPILPGFIFFQYILRRRYI